MPPIEVDTVEVHRFYKLTDDPEEVNWNRRWAPDLNLAKLILADIDPFLVKELLLKTHGSKKMGAVVALSGGIDSATSATLVADLCGHEP